MKINKLRSVLLLLSFGIFLCTWQGCDSVESDSEAENNYETTEPIEDDSADLELADEELNYPGDVSDFQTFWEGFASNVDDLDFLKDHIDFPYASAGFENALITEHEFVKHDYNHAVFRFLAEQDALEIGPLDDGYLNGFLADSFFETYGDLDNIYVVKKEPEPIGYYAYFRFSEGDYRFIGCEQLEIGD